MVTPAPAPARVFVSFAVNDRHGNVTHRVEAVSIDAEDVSLSCNAPMTFRDSRKDGRGGDPQAGAVRFGRRWFACRGGASMVGNVFWEGTWMEHAEARRLVAYLLERGWHVEEGPLEGPFADLFAEEPLCPPPPSAGG